MSASESTPLTDIRDHKQDPGELSQIKGPQKRKDTTPAEGEPYYRLERLDYEIRLILKSVAPDSTTSANMFENLHAKLRFFFDQMLKTSQILMPMAHVRTLDSRTIQTCVKLRFMGSVGENMVRKLTRSVALFHTEKNKAKAKEGLPSRRMSEKDRAQLRVRPSLVRTIAESLLDPAQEIRISKSFPIALASVLEEFLSLILSSAAALAQNQSQTRIQSLQIDLAIAEDPHLLTFFLSDPDPLYADLRQTLVRLASREQPSQP